MAEGDAVKLATKTIFPIAGLLITVGVCSSRRSRHVKFALNCLGACVTQPSTDRGTVDSENQQSL